MTVQAALRVWLKGTDLVAGTAFLTLTEKLGYADRLLALQRLDAWYVTAESADPKRTAVALAKVFSTGSTFFNPNKHRHSLSFRWDGKEETNGSDIAEVEERLRTDAAARLEGHGKENDSQPGKNLLILKDVPVFRSEVLVEELDASAKVALAQRIGSELGESVTVSAMGTCWLLALRVDRAEEATTVTNEILISQRRDRGLLLNPNAERARMLGVQRIGSATL